MRRFTFHLWYESSGQLPFNSRFLEPWCHCVAAFVSSIGGEIVNHGDFASGLVVFRLRLLDRG